MSDLETLLAELGEEHQVEIDYDAPEPGQFPPRIEPGDHEFIFHLAEDGDKRFGVKECKGQKCLEVIVELEIARPGEETPAMIKFVRVNDYKSEKMKNSSLGDLVRCLGIKPEGTDRRALCNALIGADGRARGTAQIGWQRFCKSDLQAVSTAPRKQKAPYKNEVPWPRGADKKPELIVACPHCGDKGYGREFVVNFRLPKVNGNA